jgi:putative inorganic carbon (HCO3(-)) transporter
MPHGDLAQLAAVIGALGAAAMLLSRNRRELLVGLGVTAVGEAALAVALIPAADLKLLVSPPLHLGGLVLGVFLVCVAAAALVRYPELVPIVLLAAAPFRISTEVGEQKAYLLLPLYVVLCAAFLALVARVLRGDEIGGPLPRVLAVPAAAFLLLTGVSLLWTRDLRQGTIELLFFLFPFSALVVAVVRSPFRPWHPRALAATLVALAGLFAAAGLFQRLTHGYLLAGDVERANAYTTYFRVTSLFKDPSVYGRHVVIAIAVLLVAVWLARIGFWLGTALIAFLWAGLFFSYSQSSFVALFAVVVAISVLLGGPKLRRAALVGAAACVLGGAAFVAVTAVSESAREATSGRTRLARVTWVVFQNHPLIGVGIGGQPLASKEEARTQLSATRDRSHTTPLTVAAELGIVGLIAYAALLAGAGRLLFLVTRMRRALGLGAAALLLALFVHSLFYAGFFEDPIMWGVLGLAAWSLLGGSQVTGTQSAPEILEPTSDGRPRRTPTEVRQQAPLAD